MSAQFGIGNAIKQGVAQPFNSLEDIKTMAIQKKSLTNAKSASKSNTKQAPKANSPLNAAKMATAMRTTMKTTMMTTMKPV